ncbi:hypothetical protein J4448_01585 [Candidatus Woesearchaeota archaeon]|nr:hypothetical protein [Candidatus Woesearchaeota archaeon]
MIYYSKTIGYLLIGFSAILILILAFVKADVDEQAAFLCEKFHESNLDMQQCPAHKSNISWLITLAFGISFLILGVSLYLLFMHKSFKEESKKEFKQADLSKLNEEEKRVYIIIKEKEGSAYQSDLMKETGFSKVKVTRILDKLETKDILERKRRGMTNIIVLK